MFVLDKKTKAPNFFRITSIFEYEYEITLNSYLKQ